MARVALITMAVCAVVISTADAGFIDSIKSALGLGTSSATSSVIKSNNAGTNLPNYFRIEAEIVRMENVGGLKSNGGSCDTLGHCDPVVYAYVDVLKPTSPFPGAQTLESIPKVFELSDTNSPKINKVVTADVCNKELTKATLRVHVMDRNKLFTDSLISDFDCFIGGNVGTSPNDARWTSTGNCAGKFVPDKIKLIFRSRIYRIDPRDCIASTNTIPLSTTSKSIFG